MTTLAGLTSLEAARRLAEHGPNAMPGLTPDPWWRRLLRQFRSPLIYILLFALAVEAAVWIGGRGGPPWEGLAIAVILALNAGLGGWQEWKAEHALAELERLAAPRAWVVRDGTIRRLPSAELVPGDAVRVEAGDRVPSDLSTVEPENVLVDESLLTGESLPVEKGAGDTLYAGTLVVRGTTYGEVTRTGTESAMGRLVRQVADVRPDPTPLERRLDVFGRRVARWVLGLAAALALGGLVMEGPTQFGRVFLLAVALAVAAVPEGLPAILTVALTLGVQRMARRNAVVRRLTAVEALGSVTVIATDKTGTLTENRLVVRELDSPDPDRALRAMVLASSADAGGGVGDPLELALLAHARAAGVPTEETQAAVERVSTRSFDSVSRFMRVTVRENGAALSYFKGAPEVLLQRSRLSSSDREVWEGRIERAAESGHRVIALAWGDGEREHDLRWLGLVLLWDPPRPEVRDALRQARDAGIRIIMVTGDHGATAVAVARAVGLEERGMITGAALEAMTSAERRRAVREAGIFARVSPAQKLEIVEALKADGEIVAVTGDGVNDAPALKRADVGIAMGQRGSDVSREVADLVLLDDNFATIIGAVEEGRSIYVNIQKFIRFLFSTNLSELLVVVVGAFAALTLGLRESSGELLLPLTAAQLLWINLVTDGAPALALSLDRNPGLMQASPRPPGSALLDRVSLQFIITSGAAKALVALALLGLLPMLGESRDATRTAVFMLVACGQLLFVYPVRRSRPAPLSNPALHLSVVGGLAAQIVMMQLPGLREAFQSVPLAVFGWIAVVAGSITAWAAAELTIRVLGRINASAGG